MPQNNMNSFYTIIVEDMKASDEYFENKEYMTISPTLYTDARPFRSLEINQIVMLMHNKYPTNFVVVDVFESKSDDVLVVLKYNTEIIKNSADINRMI